MKSLHTYINERLITNKDEILLCPKSKDELVDAILDHFKHGDSDLNNIDVSKLKKEDFNSLFYNLRNEIKKNNITEIDISKWKLKELYYDTRKNKGMFEQCETLESIILPGCLEVIGKYTFYKCTKLNNITIPNSVTTIDDVAFSNCSSLENITIPDSVTKIGNYTFYCCSDLTSVVISSLVTSIGGYAFYGCNTLKITVPNKDIKKLVKYSGFDGKIIVK